MKLFRKVSIKTFREQLSSFDSVPQFAILGIASGLITGLVIIAFRLLIEWPLSWFLGGQPENFEGLKAPVALILPVAGSLLLVFMLAQVNPNHSRLGVIHVMERLARHQGHLPLRNAIVQFFSGIVALATGQSGGREGPAIHLGAAGSSLLGQYLHLPNNSIRVLVGCGAAAAISASFNTPVAGVIFSMEVIVMEYTIAGFVPVILASVVAALLTHLVFGTATAFDVPTVSMASFFDIPVLIFEGIFVGIIAALFVRTLFLFYRLAPEAMWLRLLAAGLLTGLAAIAVPEVMGIGYDTVNLALIGELGFTLLLVICLLKIITTAAAIAMGMPVGLIGPSLFIGALAGGMTAIAASLTGVELSMPAFYVMLGMGAMMGAVLQAPLAALMAVLELTHNPHIILPAMLVIIVANMTASQVFGLKSVFLMLMEARGLDYRQNPLSMALNRASVASIMIRQFERAASHINVEEAGKLIAAGPQWLLVDRDDKPAFILRVADLELYLKAEHLNTEPTSLIHLAAIPAVRKDVTSILIQATLREALDALNNSGVQALYVNRITAPLMESPVGIVTREDIESYYQA